MRIGIIGSGNVAYHLVKVLTSTEAVVFVYARNQIQLNLLKSEFPTIFLLEDSNLAQLELDLVLFCVKDDALNELYTAFQFAPTTLVAHTSGTQVIEQTDLHQNVGVFYPLQTFSKSTSLNWNTVPILIEANSDEALNVLERAAGIIQAPFFETNEVQRKSIHLAAVLASNFTNHLIGKAATFLQQQSIDYHILQPLVTETIRKAFAHNPFDVQTGPAVRNDSTTITTHIGLLQTNPLIQKIYADLSESILKTHNLNTDNI